MKQAPLSGSGRGTIGSRGMDDLVSRTPQATSIGKPQSISALDMHGFAVTSICYYSAMLPRPREFYGDIADITQLDSTARYELG